MPLVIEPIKEIQQVIEPAIQKIETSSFELSASIWIILLALVLYAFRKPLYELCVVMVKIGLFISFAYLTYIFIL